MRQIVAPSLEEWVSPSTEAMVCTPSALLEAMALDVPRAAQDDEVVRRVHKGVNKVANTLNTLHSISRRIHETNRATPGSAAAASGGAGVGAGLGPGAGAAAAVAGAAGLGEGVTNPFAPAWPHLLPNLVRLVESLHGIWAPPLRDQLLANPDMMHALTMPEQVRPS